MISHKFILFAIIYFITIQALLFGSGFAIYEHGISANGLARAFGGIANNASADSLLSTLLPDSDRMGISAGISKKMSDNLTANFSYIHLFFKERTITNSELDSPLIGTYNGSAELIGLGINYKF